MKIRNNTKQKKQGLILAALVFVIFLIFLAIAVYTIVKKLEQMFPHSGNTAPSPPNITSLEPPLTSIPNYWTTPSGAMVTVTVNIYDLGTNLTLDYTNLVHWTNLMWAGSLEQAGNMISNLMLHAGNAPYDKQHYFGLMTETNISRPSPPAINTH